MQNLHVNGVSRYLCFKEVLSVLMLCAPVFIFTSGSSALLGRQRQLWLIDLTVATCRIQVYAFFVSRVNGQNTRILEVRHFHLIRKWPPTVTSRALCLKGQTHDTTLRATLCEIVLRAT